MRSRRTYIGSRRFPNTNDWSLPGEDDSAAYDGANRVPASRAVGGRLIESGCRSAERPPLESSAGLLWLFGRQIEPRKVKTRGCAVRISVPNGRSVVVLHALEQRLRWLIARFSFVVNAELASG